MQTRHLFSADKIRDFEKEYDLKVNLSISQTKALEVSNQTHLTFEQLDDIITSLPDMFIEETLGKIQPISVSLFVENDALWEIMKRKTDYPDKMLPMATIPWFYWDSDAISSQNPTGVVRRAYNDIDIRVTQSQIVIQGTGGNFCGLVDNRIVDPDARSVPIIVPKWGGKKHLVPNYECENLRISINRQSAKTSLYPVPYPDFDYRYSESPKVINMHGMEIECPGDNIKLKVSSGRNLQMNGRAQLVFGKQLPEQDDDSPKNDLVYHVWLRFLERLLDRGATSYK
ncbi:MAG: hypothetical protein RTU30_03110 [Candidatus Thorarchaeota archaeon]